MANEIYGVLFTNTHPVPGDVYYTDDRDDQSFLRDVITPIYHTLLKVVLVTSLYPTFHIYTSKN